MWLCRRNAASGRRLRDTLTCNVGTVIHMGASLVQSMLPTLSGSMAVEETGRAHLVGSVQLLPTEQQIVEEMLEGWRNQQLGRNLQVATVHQRIRAVRRFVNHVNEFPWRWTPATKASGGRSRTTPCSAI